MKDPDIARSLRKRGEDIKAVFDEMADQYEEPNRWKRYGRNVGNGFGWVLGAMAAWGIWVWVFGKAPFQ